MYCALCRKELCPHGRRVHKGEESICLDCGEKGIVTISHFALPMYEGKVNFASSVSFFVCRSCYTKYLTGQI